MLLKGHNNSRLNGNPEITFFKTLYLRHTNFAIEEQSQAFSNTPTMGRKGKCTISRSGDLLGYTYLETNFKVAGSDTNMQWPGEQMLSAVELRIGNQRIDFYDTYSMMFSRELIPDRAKLDAYWILANQKGRQQVYDPSENFTRVYTPLLFFFCKNPGKFIPLCALTHHQVEINIDFTTAPSGTITTENSNNC